MLSPDDPEKTRANIVDHAQAQVPSPSERPGASNSTSLLPRPIFHLTLFFALGIAASYLAPQHPLDRLATAAAFTLLGVHLVFPLSRRRDMHFALIPLLLFFFLGFMAGRSAEPHLPVHPGLEPYLHRGETLFVAKVAYPPDHTPERIRIPLLLHSAILDGETRSLGVSVLVSANRSEFPPGKFVCGDWVLIRLSLKRFRSFANPGAFDYARYQAEQGFYARAFLPDQRLVIKLQSPPPPLSRSILDEVRGGLDGFRQRALDWLSGSLPPDSAAFYAAILIGYQRLISDAWLDHLSRTGVIHLLSIGGLHLGLVSLFAFWLIRGFVRFLAPSILQTRADQHIALLPSLAAAALYAGIAGFASPPLWRSMLMLTFCLTAAHWYRTPDSLSVLALSALFILVSEPNALFQISFQLTFVCMAALFILYPGTERFHLHRFHPALGPDRLPGRVLRPFEEAFWVSLAVSLMVLPLTVYHFYGISVAGFFANVVLVPWVGFLVLPAGLASIVLFAVGEGVGTAALKFGAWFLELAQTMILWFSNLSWSYFWVGKPSVLVIVAFYGLLFILLCRWTWRTKTLAAMTLVVAAWGVFLLQHGMHWEPNGDQALRIDVVDVGQGACTLVRSPSGETLLIDGGGFPDDSFDMGRTVVAPFLWHSGIRRLDHVVLSHDHPDHRNGLRFVLSHFRVDCFWETGAGGETLAAVARRRGISVRNIVDLHEPIPLGACQVRFLHPSRSYLQEQWNGRNLNDASAVMEVIYGNTRCIIPGDIDRSLEKVVFQKHSVKGSVLLVAAHHGSDRSNSPFLLDHLKPQAVVFSCGYENPFRFPSEAVLEACRTRGIPVYRTDLNGAVTAFSDGLDWKVSPTLGSAEGGSLAHLLLR